MPCPESWTALRLGCRLGIVAVAAALLCSGVNVSCSTRPAAPAAIVAPIFELGDGRYWAGWLSCAPSPGDEGEAIQIIRQELAAAGVSFSQQNVELKAVRVPPRHWYRRRKWFGMGRKVKTVTILRKSMARPLVLDLVDPDRKIGIEYISQGDYFDVGGIEDVTGSGPRLDYCTDSGPGLHFTDAARYLADQVRTQATGLRVGIFYPRPSPYTPSSNETQTEWEQIEQPIRAENPEGCAERLREARESFQQELDRRALGPREFLRLQVRDFVDWLKAEGAI